MSNKMVYLPSDDEELNAFIEKLPESESKVIDRMAEILFSNGRKNKIGNETVFDNFAWEIAEILHDSVKQYDPEKGSLINLVNKNLKNRISYGVKIGSTDIEYELDPSSKDMKRLREMKKIMKDISLKSNVEIGFEKYTDDDKNRIMQEMSISEKQFNNIIAYYNFRIRRDLFSFSEDDEGNINIGPVIADEKSLGMNGYIELCISLQDMFEYILLRIKEKKHPVVKMIDTNIVSQAGKKISSYKQYTDAEYKRYSDRFKRYEDRDIILYMYFDGKRNPDKKELLNKKSLFSKTYRSEFNKYAYEWRERIE